MDWRYGSSGRAPALQNEALSSNYNTAKKNTLKKYIHIYGFIDMYNHHYCQF
jgi:hypothetical protein